MSTRTEGWLSISTEGFAAMNAARPAEHLIKELVQNAFDSFAEGQPGRIKLCYGLEAGCFVVECCDNGSGIRNLADLRVVYLTHKTDSHLKRGRFGRGFKEALCIAEQAWVESGGERLEFLLEGGERVVRQGPAFSVDAGTRVQMRMPWPAETGERLDAYFGQFLVPAGIELEVNGRRIAARQVAHRVSASLTTELYDAISQSWKKPSRSTTIHLVPLQAGETATVYEMGIPVAAASSTPGWRSSTSSISRGAMFSPPLIINSLMRPVTKKNPSASRCPKSPVRSQPSGVKLARVASGFL